VVLNINQILSNNRDRINTTSSNNLTRLELCRVDDIDYLNMKATVHLLESARVIPDVWICSTAKFGDKGFIYPPEIGSIAILGTTNKEESYILAFTSYLNQEDIQEDLLPGEILMQSKGYSFVKEDNAGNVTIGSPSNNFIVVGGDKEISQFSVNETKQTASVKETSGIIDNDVRYVEKIYNEKLNCALSTLDLANAALRGGFIDIKEPHPAMITEKGNVEGDPSKQIVYRRKIFTNVFSVPENTYVKTIKKSGLVDEYSKDNINITSEKDFTAKSKNSTLEGTVTANLKSPVTTVDGYNTATVTGGTVNIEGGLVSINGDIITISGGSITISGNIVMTGSVNMMGAAVMCPKECKCEH